MRRGFTLVELLAVIVILTVIALITIPAVMKMIESSTMNSYRRSVDLYGKAVNNAVIEYQTDMVEKGQSSSVTFDNIEPYIEHEGNDVDCKIKQIYSDKTILLTECYVDEELVSAEKNKGYSNKNYYYYTNSKKKIKLIEYIKAVEEEIKDKNINGTCTITEDKITCNGQDLTIKSNLENAIEGSIVIENSKVKSYSNLKFETEKKVETNNEGPQVIDEENTSNENNNQNNDNNSTQEKYATLVNDADNDGKISVGDKYTYKVNSNDIFNFYVLSIEGDKVNLIMDRNICNDGTVNYTSTNNYCRYQWHAGTENNNNYGPDTAMQKLYNATKEWTNVPDMIINYIDENNRDSASNGYTSIISNINTKVTTITGKNGVTSIDIGTSSQPLKARLAKEMEIRQAGCTSNNEICPAWLVENLSVCFIDEDRYPLNKDFPETDMLGYWLLSSLEGYMINAHTVNYCGYLTFSVVNKGYNAGGIRPVITIPKSYLQ